MKKIYKTLFILLLLFPFITYAKNLNDLNQKWVEQIEDGYYRIPMSNRRELVRFDQYQILEDDKGYSMFVARGVYRFDRKEKLTKSLLAPSKDRYEKLEKDKYLISLIVNEDDSVTMYKTDYQLNELGKIDIEKNTSLINMFEITDGHILITQEVDNNSKVWLKAYVLDEKFEVKSSSSVFAPNPIDIGNFVNEYRDTYNNIYYTDENHVIHARNVDKDGNIYIFKDKKLELYDAKGNLIKTVLTVTSDYSIMSSYIVTFDGYNYIALREYLNETTDTTANYKHRATIYKYDSNYSLVDTEQIAEEDTSSMYSYSLYLYANKKAVYVRYGDNYYRIDSSFNFNTSTYDEIDTISYDYYIKQPEPYYNELYYEAQDYIINNIYESKYEEVALEYADKINSNDFYLDFQFDATEINKELAIVVTWQIEYLVSTSTTTSIKYISETELIITTGEDYNSYKIVEPKERETNYYEVTNQDYALYLIDNKIIEAEGKLIISSSNFEERFIRVYSLDGKMEKELYKSEDYYLLPSHLSYSDGHMLAVFTKLVGYINSTPLPSQDTKTKLPTIGNQDTNNLKTTINNNPYRTNTFIDSEVVYFETPFEVTTKTDGKGTIKVNKTTAESGEVVEYEIIPEKGYVLGVVKVIDSNGNTITFTSNKFTMPSSDVVIDVTFVPENPGTATMGLFIITCLLIIGTGIVLSIKNIKQINWLKN